MTATGASSPAAALSLRAAAQALMAWMSSSYADRAALTRWLEALEGLLTTAPELARDIGGMALAATPVLESLEDTDALQRIVRVGLDAILLDPEPPDYAALALLILARGRALTQRGDAYGAAQSFQMARTTIATLPQDHPLVDYVALRWASFLGASLEADLEVDQAAAAYRDALARSELLYVEGAPAPALIDPWITSFYGNGPELLDGEAASVELLRGDLRDLVVSAALGSARCGRAGATGPAIAPLDALERCVREGIPHHTHPFDLRELVLALSPSEAERVVAALITAAEKEPWVSESSPWASVLLSSEARVCARAGDSSAANERLARAMAATVGKVHEALAWAVVGGDAMTLGCTPEGEFDPGLVDAFLAAYGGLFLSLELGPLNRRIKAAFDAPLSALTGWGADRYHADPSEATSSFLSLVLDAQRQPEHTAFRPEPTSRVAEQEDDSDVFAALRLATDGLQRMRVALSARPDTVALVIQPLAGETLFVTVTGRDVALARAGPAYREASAELVEAMNDDLEASLDGFEFEGGGDTEAAGRQAYAAIPDEIRAEIERHATVLIVPDFLAEVHGMPYELLHDGEGFLGERRVVARFASLGAAARALESSRASGSAASRAFVVAAPRITGYPELRFAGVEAKAIRQALSELGWDAPDPAGLVLDADLVLEAGELAGLLHIAGHGDAVAGEEALLLADDSRLSVPEIQRRALPRLPLCFINACSLGRTRYVGGGVSRGIAHAFHAAGAPAVIANTLSVEDAYASRLAVGFHKRLQEHPAGEALRLARTEMRDAGVPVPSWGATMLIGDPMHRLDATGPATGVGQPWPVTVDDVTRAREEAATGSGWADPRAAAGAVVARELWELDGAERKRVEVVLQVAESLGHRAAEALARLAVVQRLAEAGPSGELERAATRLLSVLKALEPADEEWGRVRMSVQALVKRAELHGRAEQIRVFNAATFETTDDADAIRDVILAAQAETERHAGVVSVREPETEPSDVTWNAIVLGHRLQLVRTPAALTFARALAHKLGRLNELDTDSEAEVARVLLGVLTFLWEHQRRTHLPPEQAESEARVAALAVDAAATDAARPPEPRAARVVELLDMVEADDSDPGVTASALDRMLDEAPADRLAAWTAWTHGAVLERNTPSALAGSAAIQRGARLAAVYDRMAQTAEGRFMDWLMTGYEPVRTREWSLVEAWRYDAR